jgi:hypothetical protein
MSGHKTTPTDQPPRCPMRTLSCERYEVMINPPAVPRIWACAHPDCDLAIRAALAGEVKL